MFAFQRKQSIHMCCIDNRNTSGCDRVKIFRNGHLCGYVFLDLLDKIPEKYTKSPYSTEIEYWKDVVVEVEQTSYHSILKWATEAQQMLTEGYTHGVCTNLSMIIAQAKEEIEVKNE